ncbi:hypothetical protein M885DRAFT_619002 [Pelagophyceae sp. CCMP2097]|nr:hypothetical protein M885DRAFT_619002 [Pelagophyceae sp. CCMP2097]
MPGSASPSPSPRRRGEADSKKRDDGDSPAASPTSKARRTSRQKPGAPPRRCVDVRESRFGVTPVDEFRGDRDVVDKMKKTLGWLSTRAPVRLLEEALEDGDALLEDGGKHSWTCLHHAAASGCVDHVRAILAHVRAEARNAEDEEESDSLALLDAQEGLNGFSPVHLAVIGKHPQVLRLLLRAGASATTKDKGGDAPKDLCASRSRLARILAHPNDDSDDEGGGFKKRVVRSEASVRRPGARSPFAALPPDKLYDDFSGCRYTHSTLTCHLCDDRDPPARCSTCRANAEEAKRHLEKKPRGKPGFTTKYQWYNKPL